jgi:hypothetical protein
VELENRGTQKSVSGKKPTSGFPTTHPQTVHNCFPSPAKLTVRLGDALFNGVPVSDLTNRQGEYRKVHELKQAIRSG